LNTTSLKDHRSLCSSRLLHDDFSKRPFQGWYPTKPNILELLEALGRAWSVGFSALYQAENGADRQEMSERAQEVGCARRLPKLIWSLQFRRSKT
jgi:hypothetical protein